MGQPPASAGRENQKARTRAALLQSAVALIRRGQRPTVEEAALAVGISKRTAYRYFVSQDHLLADAALDGLRDSLQSMFDSMADNTDARSRLTSLAIALAELAEAHEAELRVMMRAALDRGLKDSAPGAEAPARGGRRLEWIQSALAPVRADLSASAYRKLVNALAVCVGIDALLVLRDVCGLTSSGAGKLMGWMAVAILEKALAEASQPEA